MPSYSRRPTHFKHKTYATKAIKTRTVREPNFSPEKLRYLAKGKVWKEEGRNSALTKPHQAYVASQTETGKKRYIATDNDNRIHEFPTLKQAQSFARAFKKHKEW